MFAAEWAFKNANVSRIMNNVRDTVPDSYRRMSETMRNKNNVDSIYNQQTF